MRLQLYCTSSSTASTDCTKHYHRRVTRVCMHCTGLHLACDRCLVDKVKVLLEWGCNPTAKNAHGQTPADAIGVWGDDAVRKQIREQQQQRQHSSRLRHMHSVIESKCERAARARSLPAGRFGSSWHQREREHSGASSSTAAATTATAATGSTCDASAAATAEETRAAVNSSTATSDSAGGKCCVIS
jgi:hypothetical protein